MTTIQKVRRAAFGLTVAAGLGFGSAAPLQAAAVITDFEGFATGSVNGQGGWTVEDSFGNSKIGDPFDEAVVDDGTGNMVWRFSNGVGSGGFSNQPFSASAPQVAGQAGSGLYNDYGNDHTNPHAPPLVGGQAQTNWFYSAFDFKSVTGEAQAGMSLIVQAAARQSTWAMTWLQLADTGNGIDLNWHESVTGGGFNATSTTIASGLSYTDWHRIEMLIQFVDGIDLDGSGQATGNDIVSIFLDGNLIHTGTTWESYFHHSVGDNATRPQAVDSLLFRASGSGVEGNLGGGFYFDNVELSNIPEPTTLALLGLGGLALARRRRGRTA